MDRMGWTMAKVLSPTGLSQTFSSPLYPWKVIHGWEYCSLRSPTASLCGSACGDKRLQLLVELV